MPSSSMGSAVFLSFREFQHMVLHIPAFMQSTNLNPTSVNIKLVLHNQIGYVVEVGYRTLCHWFSYSYTIANKLLTESASYYIT